MRLVVLAVLAALAAVPAANGITVLPGRESDVLEGVAVTIPAGARPLTSPLMIARKLERMHAVANASLTSLRFCRDFAQRCIDGVSDELPSGMSGIWVARFTGAILCCSFGPPGRPQFFAPSAYYLVADATRVIFAFGTP